MSSAFQVTVPASSEPISLRDVLSYMRVDFDDENATITRLITAARMEAEKVTHRALATQTIQLIETIAQPEGGVLSGPMTPGPNWYQYQEQLGANPFGAAQFYFDLPAPPCQSITKVETRVTVWDPWVTFNGLMTLDAVMEPARVYFQVPVTANQWRFTYVAGYDNSTRTIPDDIRQAIFEIIAYWYDHREGDPLPEGIINSLLSRKVDWL